MEMWQTYAKLGCPGMKWDTQGGGRGSGDREANPGPGRLAARHADIGDRRNRKLKPTPNWDAVGYLAGGYRMIGTTGEAASTRWRKGGVLRALGLCHMRMGGMRRQRYGLGPNITRKTGAVGYVPSPM